MLIKPKVLKKHGIRVIGRQADGDYMDIDEIELKSIDAQLIEQAAAKPGFRDVYAYAGAERFWDDETRASGASMQVLFSDSLSLAGILYLDPALSGPVILWIKASSPAEAMHLFTREMQGGDGSPVAAYDAPRNSRKGH
ncbi:hypothetical protein SRABI05_00345 [Agrobacterium fabrum]|uniref:hypothetical protein n=1 Tax=Agrobacterium fabrum TaxID=1176649 RepID=UPI001D2758C3|nr:hypothetical protein [Agrobacterium fabrum]CAH0143040.1 hypothetical protein SRABI05_00345 [Agrobacterium fabrum]CAH0162584.1 hypothetical protein SRABI46_01059 [Agrobacterium fabrum]